MDFNKIKLVLPNEKKLTAKVSKVVEQFKNATNEKEAYTAFKKMISVDKDIATQFVVISIHFTLNCFDKKNKKASDLANEISPVIKNISVEFNKLLKNSEYRPYIESKVGAYYFEKLENVLRGFDEKIIPDLIQESKLVDEYDSIIASAQIEFRGQVYNMNQISKFMKEVDRDTRKEAGEKLYSWVSNQEEKIAKIYDQLVQLRTKMAKTLGFESYTELGYLNLGRTDYTKEDVKVYRKQIEDTVVPIVVKLEKERRKRINILKPYFYDNAIEYLDGNPKPIGDKDVLVNAAREMYHELSEDTDVFFNYLVDNNLMDLDSRHGKQSGGYMTYLFKYKQPFIFANFNGVSDDVDVLTHEFGHAYQTFAARKIWIPEYLSPGLEVCEMHSMSMEFFAWPWMNKFFENDVKYKHSHLIGALSFLPYGVTVDEFQHFVYENPTATHEERKAAWREIEKKYLPAKSNLGCEFLEQGGRWMLQGHVFSTPFYYIDYTIAQVVAFQFLNEDLKDHNKAWKKYNKLCALGGKYPFKELLKRCKIKSPFEEGTVSKNVKPLLKILKSLKY